MDIGFIDTHGLHNCYDEDDNDWYYWSPDDTATLTTNTITVNDNDQTGWSINWLCVSDNCSTDYIHEPAGGAVTTVVSDQHDCDHHDSTINSINYHNGNWKFDKPPVNDNYKPETDDKLMIDSGAGVCVCPTD